jgi:predicted RNA-binding Zn-ribbon protein involved in translation (DUF1610 family)
MHLSPAANRTVGIAAVVVIVGAVVWASWETSLNATGSRWKATLESSVWILLPTALITGVVVLARRALAHKQVFRFKCNRCGYSRKGLLRAAPCPECGELPVG